MSDIFDTELVVHRQTEIGDALFSKDEVYRYVLRRLVPQQFGTSGGSVAFVMLNPSTATEKKNDPTIRRCIDYAQQWGCQEMFVVNLFAYRSTHPTDLYEIDSPCGSLNDHYIEAVASVCDIVVMAWGFHGSLMGRSEQVRSLLKRVCTPQYFALTQSGEPRHPLYLSKDAKLLT